MTLVEFCDNNPQLLRPRELPKDLVAKSKQMDLRLLNDKIHASHFLMSRRSLKWVLNAYNLIIDGYYRDYKPYVMPMGSQITGNERIYTKEELEYLITPIDKIEF